jgi:hypothetical protein
METTPLNAAVVGTWKRGRAERGEVVAIRFCLHEWRGRRKPNQSLRQWGATERLIIPLFNSADRSTVHTQIAVLNYYAIGRIQQPVMTIDDTNI